MAGWPSVVGIGAVLVAAIVLVEAGRLAIGRWWRRSLSRRRAQRARAGELEAEELLEGLGFEVVERQPRRSFTLEVDGEPHLVELRADLLVARRGRRLVAEVKTGQRAPRIETRATRRQLLEYRIAYQDADGVLLVDAPAGEVHEVVFPLSAGDARIGPPLRAIMGGVVVGAVVGGFVTWLLFVGLARGLP